MKKLIARILVLTMLVAMTSGMALAANFDDMPSDWSTAALEAAVNNGLLKGDNGKIMPKAFLTRAQMAAIVGRAFGATEKASLTAFADVSTAKWYYDDLAKAVQMKVLQGDGNRLKPDSNITREEAFVVLARAFKLSGAKDDMLNHFSDKDKVSSWAKDGVAALVAAGYVSGANGKLNPKQNITRAEFAQIMHNLLSVYVTEAGNFSHDVAGNVMVNTPNAVLKNMTVTGNLIIGDGVGDGDVTLENVKVTGTTLVRGGGVNSIRIMGNTSMQNLVIARVNGEVRVFAENGTQVGTVVADGNDDVIIEGKVGSVIVEADGITVTAKNATITSATVFGEGSKIIAGGSTVITAVVVNAANSEIVTEKGATIGKIEINEDGAKVSGAGTVGTVAANANDVAVTTPGTSVTAGAGTTGVVAGDKPVTGGSTVTTPGTTTGGGSYVPPAPTPIVSTAEIGSVMLPDGDAFAWVNTPDQSVWTNLTVTGSLNYVAEPAGGFVAEHWFLPFAIIAPAGMDLTKATVAIEGLQAGTSSVFHYTGTQFELHGEGKALLVVWAVEAGENIKVTIDWDGTETAYSAKDYTINLSGLALERTVDSAEELESALKDSNVSIINITSDITATAPVEVKREVTINGGGKTLKVNGLESLAGTDTIDDALIIYGKTTVNNLKVDAGLATPGDWCGTYAIQVYGTEATLNNVTATKGNGGILVNGSNVTLTGTTTVSGNGFGGIEVSKGAGLTNKGALAVNGIIMNGSEGPSNPSVWIENDQGTVMGDIAQNAEPKTDKNQTYYYTPDIADETQLRAALANECKALININADITGIARMMMIQRTGAGAVIINGNGHKLTFTNALDIGASNAGERCGILIMSGKVMLKDISVELASGIGWQASYGVQVYNVKDVVLDGYTGTGGDAALLVNGSTVTLTGTINISGNEFGGIEVSKGVATGYPGLTISEDATFINSSEAYGLPTIWIDGDGGVANAGAFTVSKTVKAGQTQYYLVADTATLLNLAKAYEYEDKYAYTGTSVIGENAITYTASTTAFTKPAEEGNTQATMDLARLLGALYRINDGKSVAGITYDGKVYTWNTNGVFKGSNWEENGATLVSAIVAQIATATNNGTDLAPLTAGIPIVLNINNTEVTFIVKAVLSV